MCLFLSSCFVGPAKLPPLSDEEITLHNESISKFTHPTKWEKSINSFKAKDLKNPPPQNATLFVGSSSIAKWRTSTCFPDIKTINRGFGGSQIVDSWYYADSIIIPYKPKTVVFYAGDNDIANKKSPQMILANFKAFAIKIRKALPETRIVYISIKPSILRWKMWPQMKEANDLISNYCKKNNDMHFVDVSKVMLDSSGKPIEELFQADGLHMSLKGYEHWVSLVRPIINR
jgi:hypothetical protein